MGEFKGDATVVVDRDKDSDRAVQHLKPPELNTEAETLCDGIFNTLTQQTPEYIEAGYDYFVRSISGGGK